MTDAQKQLEEEDLVDGGSVMSLFDHLGELRGRVIKSGLTILAIFVVAYGFSDYIINFLKQPLIAVLPEGSNIHFTGPLDVFMTKIKVSFLVAVIGGCPLWIFQFWKFLEPALYPKERKYILPFAISSSLLFLVGVSFCYFLILPMTLDFLIKMGLEIGTPIITITDYTSLLLILIFGFGLVFETPVILVLLAVLDLVTVEGLKEYRRIVAVAILILGAALTPPDPISQVALAVPVYLMYEMSIVIIRIIKGKSSEDKATTKTS